MLTLLLNTVFSPSPHKKAAFLINDRSNTASSTSSITGSGAHQRPGDIPTDIR